MMNPLDSFTVERLEQLAETKGFPSLNVVRDLAMIALAAKQTKPDGALTHEGTHGWIKCSERMPEGKRDVQLFCSDTREQFVGFHRGNGRFQFFSMNDVVGECEPTYWMPLPAAPKPE